MPHQRVVMSTVGIRVIRSGYIVLVKRAVAVLVKTTLSLRSLNVTVKPCEHAIGRSANMITFGVEVRVSPPSQMSVMVREVLLDSVGAGV